ncbi:acetyltransferase [bacterium]|nr:acetyltransferase [bacterium]
MSKLSIVGAGGHTRTLIHIARLNNIELDFIYDNVVNDLKEKILGIQVKLLTQLPIDAKVIISKGTIADKVELTEQFKKRILIDNIIHPKALIEAVQVGNSNQVSPMVYVSNTSSIGSHNVIYTGTVIEHESSIGDFNIVTVNVSICGRVTIGNRCYFGAGSSILPNVSICDDVIIGAGAVVTRDITEKGTYVGVPAKRLIL